MDAAAPDAATGDGSDDRAGDGAGYAVAAAAGGRTMAADAAAPASDQSGPANAEPAALPAVELPHVTPVDLNAIRSPVVRAPPMKAQLKADKILRDTGTTPSQHHANIQRAVFRVSEAARKAQRDMVLGVDSIALNTRWSIERMADGIDAVVDRCVATVNGAARSALNTIESAVTAHESVIALATAGGEQEMRANQETVSTQILDNLNVNGAGVMKTAHDTLVAKYVEKLAEVGPKITGLVDGQTPVPLTTDAGATRAVEWEELGDKSPTFQAAADKIATDLSTVPGAGGGTGVASPYYQSYIDRGKAQALPYLKNDAQTQWLTAAQRRVTDLESQTNKNRFVLTSLGLIAPTMAGMERDETEYGQSLDTAIREEHGDMADANRRAIKQMRRTLDGVRNYFDPGIAKSMPRRATKSLRDNGAKIKASMYDQARVLQASLRSSVAEMATSYPDLVVRLELMLQGDDLMHETKMLPRIAGVSDSVQALLQGHLDMMRAQARDALGQTRDGYSEQVKAMWDSVDNTLSGFHEQKQKALFHFAMEEGMFTGEFSAGLREATHAVRGYANRTARELMRPIRAGAEAGGRVDVLTVNHFNNVLRNEHAGILTAIEGFPEQIGVGDRADPGASKAFPKIHGQRNLKLRSHANKLSVAVPEPKTEEMGWSFGLAILAAPFSGGLSLAAAGVGAYFAYSSIPDLDDAAEALAMPWPGVLAMDAMWSTLGEAQQPNGRARIAKQARTSVNPNWAKLLGLYSTSESAAAAAKSTLITDADWPWGINDNAVAAMAQSFSPTELALLDPEQVTAMSESIKDNLSGTQLDVTQAYIDGNPARAAAIRIEEALNEARRKGDVDMANFTTQMDALIQTEMENASTAGFVSPSMTRQLTDQMYVELAARIPPPGEARSVPLTGAAAPGAMDDIAATPAGGQTADLRTRNTPPTDAERAQALQADANARAGSVPDAQAVADARQRFITHATRDYVQFDTNYSLLFDDGQDDWLAGDLARLQGNTGAQGLRLGNGRRVQGGLIFDPMSQTNRAMIEAYVNNGPQSQEYRDAKTAGALNTAGQGYWGTSEQELISVLRETGNQQLYQARDKYQRLAADPNADATKVAQARAAMDAAQASQDQRIMTLARQMGGGEDGEPLTPDAAKAIVAARINTIAAGFDPALANIGNELLTTGRMNLAVGMNTATAGAGTYDDLLMHVTGNRTRSDIAQYDINHAALGSVQSDQRDWFAETSGDQAQQLEINLMGIPENDAQRLEIANVRTRHEAHDGTGFLADITMETSWQKEQMEQTHAAMGARAHTALQAYLEANPDHGLPEDIAGLTAEELMPLGGPVHPIIAERLMDADGRLLGEGPALGMLTAQSQLANTAYREEIARQESFFTAAITALTVAASILLLFVPGVNAVAAGVLIALIGGAATIAVKAGMRGDRYGWEEAAVDVARTGIEAAMGGVGGALGGGVKAGVPVLGRIASVGSKINGAFGRLGGTLGKAAAASVREGVTSAVSGVANTALDDKIWSKGTGHGLGELFKAGTRGAVTGALSAGVSEVVGPGLNKKLTPGLPDGDDLSRLTRLGDRLGPAGRDALQEAVSGAAGTISSEAVNILFDLSEGKAKLNLADFVARLGKAGLKDFLTSGAKAGIKNQFKATYLAERDRVMRSGEDVTPAQAKFLRKLAISAGLETYGADTTNPHAANKKASFTADSAFRDELLASQAVFRQLPPDLQGHAAGMSYDHLAALRQLREGGADAYPGDLKALGTDLATTYPGLNVRDLLQSVGRVRSLDKGVAHQRRMAAQKRQGQATRTRKRVTAGLEPAVRAQLADLPVGEIVKLPVALQKQAARLLAEGDDGAGLARLLAEAQAAGGDVSVDPKMLRAQLEGLMSARPIAEAAAAQQAAGRRAELEQLLPPDVAAAVGRLSDKDAAFVHRVLTAEEVPPKKALENIEKMLGRHLNEEAKAGLTLTLLSANGQAETTRRSQAAEARAARSGMLAHVPEDQRATMAHLSEKDLLAVAFAQAGTVPLTDAQIALMVQNARKTAPEMSADALHAAIARTVRAPAARRPFFERFAQRRALISFVPRQMRAMVRRTPILSVPDDMFAAYVKTHDGTAGKDDNAVTLRLNGEVVIVVRDGAPGHVLREEGYHVLQMRDPNWEGRLSQLDEDTLKDWPTLPAARKVELARIAIAAEIDAHRAMLAGLDVQAMRAVLGSRKRSVAHETDLAEARLASLMRRAGELDSLSPSMLRAIDAGIATLPGFLAQPARLFSQTHQNAAKPTDTTAQDAPVSGPKTELDTRRDELQSVLDGFGDAVKGKKTSDVDTGAFAAQVAEHMHGARTPAHVEALTAVTRRYIALMKSRTGPANTKKFAAGLTRALTDVVAMDSPELLQTMTRLMDNDTLTGSAVLETLVRLQAIEGFGSALGSADKGQAVAAVIAMAVQDKTVGDSAKKSGRLVLASEYVKLIEAIGSDTRMDMQMIARIVGALQSHFSQAGHSPNFADGDSRKEVRNTLASLAAIVRHSAGEAYLTNTAMPQLSTAFRADGTVDPAQRADLANMLSKPFGASLPEPARHISDDYTKAIAAAQSGDAALLNTIAARIIDSATAPDALPDGALAETREARIRNLVAVAMSLGENFRIVTSKDNDLILNIGSSDSTSSGRRQIQPADVGGLLFFANQMMHSAAISKTLAEKVSLGPLTAEHLTRLMDPADPAAKKKPEEIFVALSLLHEHLNSPDQTASEFYFRALHTDQHPGTASGLTAVRLKPSGDREGTEAVPIDMGARNFSGDVSEADIRRAQFVRTLGLEADISIQESVRQLRAASGEDDDRLPEATLGTVQRADKDSVMQSLEVHEITLRGGSLAKNKGIAQMVAEQIMDGALRLKPDASPFVVVSILDANGKDYQTVVYELKATGTGAHRRLSPYVGESLIGQNLKSGRFELALQGGDTYPAMAQTIVSKILEKAGNDPIQVDTFARMIRILANDTTARSGEGSSGIDKHLQVLAHIIAGSEVNRDTTSLGGLLLTLGIGAHLRSDGSIPAGRSSPDMPGYHLFGDADFRSERYKKLSRFVTDDDNRAFMYKDKADPFAEYSGVLAAFLAPNLEALKLHTGGLTAFTKVDYLAHRTEVERLLSSPDGYDASKASAMANAIIRTHSEQVALAVRIIDAVYPFTAEERALMGAMSEAAVEDFKLGKMVEFVTTLMKVNMNRDDTT